MSWIQFIILIAVIILSTEVIVYNNGKRNQKLDDILDEIFNNTKE